MGGARVDRRTTGTRESCNAGFPASRRQLSGVPGFRRWGTPQSPARLRYADRTPRSGVRSLPPPPPSGFPAFELFSFALERRVLPALSRGAWLSGVPPERQAHWLDAGRARRSRVRAERGNAGTPTLQAGSRAGRRPSGTLERWNAGTPAALERPSVPEFRREAWHPGCKPRMPAFRLSSGTPERWPLRRYASRVRRSSLKRKLAKARTPEGGGRGGHPNGAPAGSAEGLVLGDMGKEFG